MLAPKTTSDLSRYVRGSLFVCKRDPQINLPATPNQHEYPRDVANQQQYLSEASEADAADLVTL